MRAQGAIQTALTLLSLVFGVSEAHAWTEANVQSVEASVNVDARGHARVDLLLTVRIGGGWLTGLDIAGLDPDLTLVADAPPWARSADDPTRTWSPDVRTREGGLVRLRFPRRGSPRRGTLLVGLSYTTDLAGRGTAPIDDGRVRVSWTLPGWRAGLDNVEVTIATPEGAEPSPSMEEGTEAADEHHEADEDGRSVHVFRRIHLPRTVPWTVSVDLPADALDPGLRGPTIVAPPEIRTPDEDEGDSLAGLAMILLVAFVSLASRASFASTCRARGSTPRPIVPGPFWLLLPAVVGLGALGMRYADEEPIVTVATLIAIASVAIQRPPRPGRATSPATVGPRAYAEAATERFGAALLGSPLLDATTLTGAALLFASVCTALSFEPGFGALELAAVGLSAVPFLAATRFHLPPSAGQRLVALRRFAQTLTEVGPVALRIEAGPRLAVVLADAPPGLTRFEVAMCDRAVLGGWESRPLLIVETAAESEAEERLADLEVARTSDDATRTRIRPAGAEVIRAIAERLAGPDDREDAPLLAAA